MGRSGFRAEHGYASFRAGSNQFEALLNGSSMAVLVHHIILLNVRTFIYSLLSVSVALVFV